MLKVYHPDDPPMPCQGPDDDNDDKIRQQEISLVRSLVRRLEGKKVRKLTIMMIIMMTR